MKREDALKNLIKRYLTKEQLFEREEFKKLERSFVTKARKNFTVANLLFKISEEESTKKSLNLAFGFEMYDWVIVVSYYAMYTSALAALSRLGFKSKSHAATIAVLEYYYLHKKKGLETKHLYNITKAYMISDQLITKLMETKSKRETAQYDATPAISRENAVAALSNADEFIAKIEEILD